MSDFTLIINSPPQIISTLASGQGPAGAASSTFEYAQAVASATWVVNHNLGFRPNVAVLSVGGVEMWAEIVHISVNQVQVLFDFPRAGLALCS